MAGESRLARQISQFQVEPKGRLPSGFGRTHEMRVLRSNREHFGDMHLMAVTDDLDALRLHHIGEEFGFSSKFVDEIRNGEAVILELLPRRHREIVAAAAEAGILQMNPVFGGKRTAVRGRRSIASIFGLTPKISELMGL